MSGDGPGPHASIEDVLRRLRESAQADGMVLIVVHRDGDVSAFADCESAQAARDLAAAVSHVALSMLDGLPS